MGRSHGTTKPFERDELARLAEVTSGHGDERPTSVMTKDQILGLLSNAAPPATSETAKDANARSPTASQPTNDSSTTRPTASQPPNDSNAVRPTADDPTDDDLAIPQDSTPPADAPAPIENAPPPRSARRVRVAPSRAALVITLGAVVTATVAALLLMW